MIEPTTVKTLQKCVHYTTVCFYLRTIFETDTETIGMKKNVIYVTIRPNFDLPTLTVIVSRAPLPLIPHGSHTLPLISADRPPYGNRLNFLP